MKSEKHTRKEIIDLRLKQAGWNIIDRTQVIEEFDIVVDETLAKEASTPYSGRQFSDYVLLGKDGKPLAVVEEKKTLVDAAIGREQAKQYCYNIQTKHGGDLPALSWFRSRHSIENGEVYASKFYTPQESWSNSRVGFFRFH